MNCHTVEIEDTGESYPCHESRTVLDGMAVLGRKGIPVGCHGGGCGVCKIQIVAGDYDKEVMSREHVSADEEAKGVVLACRVKPTSDLRLHVLGRMKKHIFGR